MTSNPERNLMTRSNLGPLSSLATFDLRNGTLASAVSLLTKAAIPAGFRWRPINGLPVARSISHTDMFIKSVYLGLQMSATVGMTVEQMRKVAIVMGTARAVITELYRIEPADLIPGETAEWLIRYIAPDAEGGNETWELGANLSAEQETYLRGDLQLTDIERAVMSDMLMCAVGIPAVHGASLIATGHHYLSDVKEKSRAMYLVIERQFWKKEPTKTWVEADIELIQDALWHKAGHPVNMTIKYRAAVDPTIADKIRAAGAGSAASRLPAKESVLRAAETTRTLILAVRPFFESYGGDMDCDLLSKAIEVASAYVPQTLVGPGEAQTVTGVDVALIRTERTPAWVVNRETAIRDLDEILKRNIDTIAIAFGFFEGISEATALSGAGTENQTLLGANSLQKLRTQCFAAYTMGKEAYADYKAYKAAQRQAGEYKPVKGVII